jgi:hypothetical protein
MNPKRIHYGRCSFVLPEGFIVQERASQVNAHPSGFMPGIEGAKAPVCITLTSTAVHPRVPVFSLLPQDMNPDAYPVSITLTSQIAPNDACPLHHLRTTADVLRRYYKGFELGFCKRSKVGEYPAARAQCSFTTNFTIYQLLIVWLVDRELVTCTAMVPEAGVETGWKGLERFVDSIRLR